MDDRFVFRSRSLILLFIVSCFAACLAAAENAPLALPQSQWRAVQEAEPLESAVVRKFVADVDAMNARYDAIDYMSELAQLEVDNACETAKTAFRAARNEQERKKASAAFVLRINSGSRVPLYRFVPTKGDYFVNFASVMITSGGPCIHSVFHTNATLAQKGELFYKTPNNVYDYPVSFFGIEEQEAFWFRVSKSYIRENHIIPVLYNETDRLPEYGEPVMAILNDDSRNAYVGHGRISALNVQVDGDLNKSIVPGVQVSLDSGLVKPGDCGNLVYSEDFTVYGYTIAYNSKGVVNPSASQDARESNLLVFKELADVAQTIASTSSTSEIHTQIRFPKDADKNRDNAIIQVHATLPRDNTGAVSQPVYLKNAAATKATIRR